MLQWGLVSPVCLWAGLSGLVLCHIRRSPGPLGPGPRPLCAFGLGGPRVHGDCTSVSCSCHQPLRRLFGCRQMTSVLATYGITLTAPPSDARPVISSSTATAIGTERCKCVVHDVKLVNFSSANQRPAISHELVYAVEMTLPSGDSLNTGGPAHVYGTVPSTSSTSTPSPEWFVVWVNAANGAVIFGSGG